jgi:peptidoglycan/LPS O-acetylase OafA/YrhL
MDAANAASAHTENQLLTNPKYRPDIDGLRGIAVLAVIGFHAFPQVFRGGFVGVDIFFVISGFLISSILFRNFEEDSFSYSEFYGRRVKRIFPSLIVVLLPCLVFGWLLLPTEFRQLGKHIAAGAGFVSNFAFWQEAGYFDTTAANKPLLHLWSLGIEEQFYIFWPLLLGLCWRRRLNFLSITILVALASFATNLYLTQVNPVAAFYSPLSRFWELMIGGLLAYLVLHRPQSLPSEAKWVPFAGFLLIVVGILLLHSETPFPGWWALLPVLGSFLTIAAGPNSWLNSKVLSNRVLVSIGLISYPLYLWHWPVLYAARRLLLYRFSGVAAAGVLLGCVVFSILLSCLTYRLIEVPIRFGRLKRKATRPLVALMALLLLAGVVTYQTDGFGFLYSAKAMEILDHDFKTVAEKSYRTRTCFLESDQDFSQFRNCTSQTTSPPAQSVLLWGDSHAAHLYPGLADNISPAIQLTQFTASSCPPIVGVEIKSRRNCRAINDFVLNYVTRAHPYRVFSPQLGRGMTGNWSVKR